MYFFKSSGEIYRRFQEISTQIFWGVSEGFSVRYKKKVCEISEVNPSGVSEWMNVIHWE